MKRRRRAIILLASSIVPPIIRFTCDDATKVIRDVSEDALNARVIGSLYAGAIDGLRGPLTVQAEQKYLNIQRQYQ